MRWGATRCRCRTFILGMLLTLLYLRRIVLVLIGLYQNGCFLLFV